MALKTAKTQLRKVFAESFSLSILPALLSIVMSWNAFAQTPYLPGRYKVDPAHTRVSFVVPHFVVSEVEGRFNDVKGEFMLAETFTQSSVTATIPVRSIDTAVKKRDNHLRSKDFFEVAKYPEMKLVSKSLTGTPESFKVVAALTIKDVTKDVTFDGKYTGSVKDSWGHQRTALQLNGLVNRKDFNINYNDKVNIGPAKKVRRRIQPTPRIWPHKISCAGDHHPLLYELGATDKGDEMSFEFEGIQNGSISMRAMGF